MARRAAPLNQVPGCARRLQACWCAATISARTANGAWAYEIVMSTKLGAPAAAVNHPPALVCDRFGLMRPPEHIGERHQEDVVTVFIAHVHGPRPPIVRRLAANELLHDLLGALVRLDQVFNVTAILVEQDPLRARAVEINVGHVISSQEIGRSTTMGEEYAPLYEFILKTSVCPRSSRLPATNRKITWLLTRRAASHDIGALLIDNKPSRAGHRLVKASRFLHRTCWARCALMR